MEINKKLTATRLKELRESKNLTIVELSHLINIPRSTMSRYELGITLPSAESLFKYATYFKESADYLLGLEDEDGSKLY